MIQRICNAYTQRFPWDNTGLFRNGGSWSCPELAGACKAHEGIVKWRFARSRRRIVSGGSEGEATKLFAAVSA